MAQSLQLPSPSSSETRSITITSSNNNTTIGYLKQSLLIFSHLSFFVNDQLHSLDFLLQSLEVRLVYLATEPPSFENSSPALLNGIDEQKDVLPLEGGIARVDRILG